MARPAYTRTAATGRRGASPTPFPRTPDEVKVEASEGHGALDKEKHPTLVSFLSRGGRRAKLYGPRFAKLTAAQLVKTEAKFKEKTVQRHGGAALLGKKRTL